MSARLRTKVTMFFVLAALPAVVVSIGAVIVIDRLIASEIERSASETFHSVKRGLEAEQARIRGALDRVIADQSLRELADTVEHGAAIDRSEGLAPLLAAEVGLSVLAIVAARGPDAATIVSSAHLPTAAGDPAPRAAQFGATEVGFGTELVAGNPPSMVPVILAARITKDDRGRGALVVYGGRRLDADFLEMLAGTRGAGLVLEAPGAEPQVFGPVRGAGGRSIALPPVDPELDGAKIRVAVSTARLERAQSLFAAFAAGLVLVALIGALVAGAWISRRITEPILDLAAAAAEVGAGRLDVRVERTSADEVGALVDVFNQMVGEVAESRERLVRAERLAAWREAARRVAHEIKNPLTPMRMAMETLRKAHRAQHPELDEIVDESTTAVLEEVRALSRIVTEFAQFARLPKPRPETVEVTELIEHTVRLFGSPPEGVNLAFNPDVLHERPLPTISVDRDQLHQTLLNLVKNAIEAMETTGGTVTLDAHPANDGVAIEVADDGPGIDEDTEAQLFVPYFTTKSSGTGLGLAMVERIVHEHGGTIEVESNDGATFRIWLPAA